MFRRLGCVVNQCLVWNFSRLVHWAFSQMDNISKLHVIVNRVEHGKGNKLWQYPLLSNLGPYLPGSHNAGVWSPKIWKWAHWLFLVKLLKMNRYRSFAEEMVLSEQISRPNRTNGCDQYTSASIPTFYVRRLISKPNRTNGCDQYTSASIPTYVS